MVMALTFVTSLGCFLISNQLSKKAVQETVEEDLMNLAKSIATSITEETNSQFTTLNTLATLSLMKDEKNGLHLSMKLVRGQNLDRLLKDDAERELFFRDLFSAWAHHYAIKSYAVGEDISDSVRKNITRWSFNTFGVGFDEYQKMPKTICLANVNFLVKQTCNKLV